MKLGIIGSGFVGSAVANGFSVDTEQVIVDPKFTDNTLEDLEDTEIAFVCVPTPQQDTHLDVDTSIARSVLQELNELEYKGVVVVKSTITPHHLKQFKTLYKKLRLVYNPEFLTEANSLQDFINPNMQILGGELHDCIEVEQAYIHYNYKHFGSQQRTTTHPHLRRTTALYGTSKTHGKLSAKCA